MFTSPNLVDFSISILIGGIVGAAIWYIRFLNRPEPSAPVRSRWRYILSGALAGTVGLIYVWRFEWVLPAWDYVLVALLGAGVGIGELSSRYRDAPIKAILSIPAGVYVLLNATAALFALVLGQHFRLWEPSGNPVAWSAVLTAGLGAMVILRSSVFQIRVGDQDVAIGPSSFLQSVIDAADRAVDRLRAQERAWAVARVMENVSTEKALALLPSYLSALMQNLNPSEKGDFDKRIETLRVGKESDHIKSLILGLFAMNYMGEGVLRAAVASLSKEIQRATGETADAASEAAAKARGAQRATQGLASALSNAVGTVKGAFATTSAPEAAQAAVDAVHQAAERVEAAVDATVVQTEKVADVAEYTSAVVNAAAQTANFATTSAPEAAHAAVDAVHQAAERAEAAVDATVVQTEKVADVAEYTSAEVNAAAQTANDHCPRPIGNNNRGGLRQISR